MMSGFKTLHSQTVKVGDGDFVVKETYEPKYQYFRSYSEFVKPRADTAVTAMITETKNSSGS
ncbi:hypothetical protein M5E06_06905 [Azospirillum sp. A1-3]|uniref:hypothetical protein n=1 Tax=Azospirillum sp. A1-3 TaxID=185874 RepID=UPI0020772998|nr:hypothetical protein [Azospirillum sp. A1-3]MCM8733930.1 hypothetical protein [Azospirillum sp. A1-3]